MSKKKKEWYKRERRYGRYLLTRVLSSAEVTDLAMDIRYVPNSSVWEMYRKYDQDYEHTGLCLYKEEEGWCVDITFLPGKWIWGELSDKELRIYVNAFEKLETQRFRVISDAVDAVNTAVSIIKEKQKKADSL